MKLIVDQSFSKKERICKSKDFEKIFSCGKKVFFNNFLVYIYERNDEENITRLGIIVSKKTQKSAVIRNKFKRRIREIFRKNKVYIKKGVDILVIGTKISVKKDFDSLKQNFIEILKKENLWDFNNLNDNKQIK
ncbi:MAG: ribonuclease P protein component [Endomicrobiia bacterium]